ncbi:hypothetical protein DPMN_051176 [Dreissena polymorpha]|uniref:Uncharacterized protein n=1 Tax=Dreissena polymorpha TaxID=45954 RepID=A0A9D4CI42_DREPO|nr:hypothetical protein DPMN_051176 [Dreissena polymorpha]
MELLFAVQTRVQRLRLSVYPTMRVQAGKLHVPETHGLHDPQRDSVVQRVNPMQGRIWGRG